MMPFLGRVGGLNVFLRDHMLLLVVASYGLAAVFPAAGLWIRDAGFMEIQMGLAPVKATIPALLLAILLLGGGLRVQGERARAMLQRPVMLIAGIFANLTVPVVFLVLLMPPLGLWHNPDETAAIVIGLGLVASMPVAGSSTGWAQHAGADMALSLGMVLVSTLLSPLTTPVMLGFLGAVSPARAGAGLRLIAGRETGAFLVAWVLIPSSLGIVLRQILTTRLMGIVERLFGPLATLSLLVLCYANASACLPLALANGDWDFLSVISVAVLGMSAIAFFMGYTLGRLFRADRQQQAALMYGMGMNNNGTGLVLASVALSSRPFVLLPLILYNLGQHLLAGCVNALFRARTNDRAS